MLVDVAFNKNGALLSLPKSSNNFQEKKKKKRCTPPIPRNNKGKMIYRKILFVLTDPETPYFYTGANKLNNW